MGFLLWGATRGGPLLWGSFLWDPPVEILLWGLGLFLAPKVPQAQSHPGLALPGLSSE